jgi:MFS family permease
VPRLPEIKASAGLTDAAYGAGIAAFSVGAVIAGIAAAWLINRFGSGRVTVSAAIASAAILLTPALAGSLPAFALAVFALGALDSLMDVAMNAHALRVQRALGRSTLHAMHAWWSIGAITGGATGVALGASGVPPTVHLAAVGLALALVAGVAQRGLLPGPDTPPTGAVSIDRPRRPTAGPALAAIAGLGAFVVLAAIVEDAPTSWSGIHLREDLGVPAGLAGSAYVASMLAMTLTRLAGDRLVDRVGAVALVRAGGLLSAAALGLGLLIDQPLAIVLAFAAVGVGAAPAYPAAFQAAEHIPGRSAAAGVAAVSLIGRFGFLLAPLVVGAVAEAASLRTALLVPVVASLLVAASAGVVRGRRTVGLAEPAGTAT